MSLLIRPVDLSDLDAVFALAEQTGPGMTSLPADRELLEAKIRESVNSFKIEPTKVGDEAYRFVMELDGELVGIAALRARVGGFEPFYSYAIKQAKKQCQELEVDKEVEYLELAKVHDGPSILSSLFLAPSCRGKGLGKYLSIARFVFMHNQPQRFTDTVIAEVRGVIDEQGKSPFWEGTIRHFFDMEYDKADYLSSKDKGFIAELMPKYPIYIPLLRDSVIDVIGKVHKDTEPAMRFLEKQGFKKNGHVDIFDAGPTVESKISEIDTVKQIKLGLVEEIVESLEGEEQFLMSDNSSATLASFNDGKISRTTAELLDLKIGDQLTIV